MISLISLLNVLNVTAIPLNLLAILGLDGQRILKPSGYRKAVFDQQTFTNSSKLKSSKSYAINCKYILKE